MYTELSNIKSQEEDSKMENDQSPSMWDDHNVDHEECQVKDQNCLCTEAGPVQCTEDLSEEEQSDSGCSIPSSEQEDPRLHRVDDYTLDLPLNALRNQDSESMIKDCKLHVTEVEDLDNSRIVEKLGLSLKMKPTDDTDRKLSGPSAPEENVDNSELELTRYLKNSFRQLSGHRVSEVYMLHVQNFSTPVADKQQSRDPSFPKGCETEWNRLATYTDFPQTCQIFAIKLARDGFVYRHEQGSVDCNFCGLQISLSELCRPGIMPDKIHGDRSPHCPLKQGVECGNEPVPTTEQFSGFPHEPSNSMSASPTEITESTGQQVTTSAQASSRNGGETVAGIVHNQSGRTAEVYQTDAVLPPQSPVQQQTPLNRGTDSAHAREQPIPTGQASSGADRANSSSSRQNKNRTSVAAAPTTANARSANTNTSRSSNSSRKASTSSNNSSTASGAATQEKSSGGNTKEGEDAPQKLTYADLGIFSEKPKRADMVVMQKRLASFVGKWKDTHAQTPEILAAAGMYYAGYADCARCFFCAGGLKNWDPPDNPWIEHARWFPKCAYLRMVKGSTFVEIVQAKNKNKEPMTLKQVEDEVSVKTAISLSSSEGAASNTGSNSRGNSSGVGSSVAAGVADSHKDLRELVEENEELKMNTSCKICMDEESSVVFLPCGHLVACTQCAIALKSCPLCRSEIKGSVRAHMG